jgi:hypothetical protein
VFITEEDFEMLSSTKMQWSGYDWELQADRFDNREISFEFQWGYWFDSRTALILARNFLMQREIAFNESYDAAMESFVIVTDYALEAVYF